MAYTKKRSPAVSQASPAHSLFLRRIGAEGRNFTSSTPAAVPRPLPEFVEENNRLFHIKNNLPFRSSHLLPKSPAKSAPPKSRVFPHRQWAHYKAHAVSFRDENNAADSAIQSKFYDSDRSELYFEQCFTIEKKVGEGSFGEVMKVKSLDSGKQYAIKRSREKFRNETDRKRKLDEVKKHEQIPKHPNCVEFVKAWEENQRLYIQTELCKMSVQEYWETKGSVPEVRVWQMLIDLLNGLEHIHSHGFIHLDIKPANIFLSDSGVCKIGDFGLVVEHTDIADAREGDNKYMAPELLNSVFSAKADVFSLGITILELASNMELPKQGNAWRLLRVGYIPPECVEGISQELHGIIQWMLAPECDERPTISDVLNHPAVKNHKRKMMPSKVYAVFERVLCACIFYLLALVKFFLCPFKILLRALPKPKIESVSNMDKCQWETTDPHLHRTSSNESICAPELSQHHTVTFFTPKVKSRNHSHFTPTPRNSSPMASRSMHRYPGDISPDLSPLSHNKSHGNRLDSIGTHQSNLNFFLSDLSDTEDSMYKSDSLLATKPRNLLDELNNLSDSDA